MNGKIKFCIILLVVFSIGVLIGTSSEPKRDTFEKQYVAEKNSCIQELGGKNNNDFCTEDAITSVVKEKYPNLKIIRNE